MSKSGTNACIVDRLVMGNVVGVLLESISMKVVMGNVLIAANRDMVNVPSVHQAGTNTDISTFLVNKKIMIQNMTRCSLGTARIDQVELHNIASYLRDRIVDKGYNNIGRPFTASDLVGQNQIEWEQTPLKAIVEHYPEQHNQNTALGRILKKVVFDMPEMYEYTSGFVTSYCRIR